MYETSCQSRFDARYWMLGAGALGQPRGKEWGGRREEGSGWGTHVYLWRIHFDIWQNEYNYVKFKNKIKFKKKTTKIVFGNLGNGLIQYEHDFSFLLINLFSTKEIDCVPLSSTNPRARCPWREPWDQFFSWGLCSLAVGLKAFNLLIHRVA